MSKTVKNNKLKTDHRPEKKEQKTSNNLRQTLDQKQPKNKQAKRNDVP